LQEKTDAMEKWWIDHKKLLIKTWLKKEHILEAVKHKKLQLRDYVKDFLLFLKEHKIPLIIFSASGLWTDSIEMFLKERWIDYDNIFVISNSFIWDEQWNAVDFKKPIIHTFSKNESVIDKFPSIQDKIKWRNNVLLLWDSLWDANMVKSWNVIKIWFLNDKIDELLEEYKKHYDIIILNDGDFTFINKLLW
jgi:5'-nucleotidase